MEMSARKVGERDSNMELLRVVAMLMIVVFHIVHHVVINQFGTIPLFNYPLNYDKLFLLTIIRTFGYTSNNIFLIISGYFMANRGKITGHYIDMKRISTKLLLQVGFAALMLMLISSTVRIFFTERVTAYGISVFNSMNWYVGYYLAVILIAALFLNDFLLALDENKYMACILTMLALMSFTWTNSLISGFSGELVVLLLGVLMYSIGGFIRKFNPFEPIRSYVFVLIIVIIYVLVYLSQYVTTLTNITTYMYGEKKEMFEQTIVNFPKRGIVPFVLSICIFELFRRVHIPSSKMINFLGNATFMIYLFHDNNFVRNIWNMHDWITPLHNNPALFLVQLSLCGALTFVCGVGIYVLYMLTGFVGSKMKHLFIK